MYLLLTGINIQAQILLGVHVVSSNQIFSFTFRCGKTSPSFRSHPVNRLISSDESFRYVRRERTPEIFVLAGSVRHGQIYDLKYKLLVRVPRAALTSFRPKRPDVSAAEDN